MSSRRIGQSHDEVDRASSCASYPSSPLLTATDEDITTTGGSPPPSSPSTKGLLSTLVAQLERALDENRNRRRPPIQVEDFNLLFYDVALIINLSLSISFWAVHRMDFTYIGSAVNEGCLMSILWIVAGLGSTGAFLYSAVDGHNNPGGNDNQSGPKAAALLGFNTFLNAINLRLVFALLVAVLEHRPVGTAPGEQLVPLEIGFGFVLMAAWRGLHSSFVPRL